MKTVRQTVYGIISVLALFMPVVSYAQTIPGSADTSRFDDRFQKHSPTMNNTIEPPKTTTPSTLIPDAIDGFTLKSLEIKGNSAFDTNDFQPILEDYLGKSVDFNVLSHLAARLTQYYQDNGFFLARAIIPEQEVKNGHVTIQIIEGYVNDVILSDPDHLITNDTLSILQKTIHLIESLDPLHGPTFERYMLLLNEGSKIQISSLLSSAKNKEIGAIDVTLSVTPIDDSRTLTYNNHGSRFVGPHQVEATYLTGNIFTPFDQLTVQAVASAPTEESQYGTISYALPINENGLKLQTSLSYTNSEPGLNLQDLDVESDSFSFKSGLIYPYIRSRRENLTLSAFFNFKNTATEFLDAELIDDKIRFLSLSADYNEKTTGGNFNAANLSLHQGLDFLGATQTGSENLSRSEGRSDFFKITGSLVRMQNFPEQNIAILGQIEGQYADTPLLSSAEFGYGGSTLGRAYDPSEITGDKGVAAGLELRYTGISPIKNHVLLTPFTFYDIGKVWNNDAGSQPVSAASAGLGLHYNTNMNINGSLTVAYPLTKSVSTPVMGGENGPRVLLDINFNF